ncbi:hypothetical protein [Methylobacterium sp. J-067]|uniref:hypothetical protein n=1 Tax=Methylobacterium sp. J-067 TaxID=2836648 RepID=UPI001FBA38C8|nr:hypothetical protein [Methylobacterium sp. J-067]MCJ2023640.1 hypothetical protein [Methylobacterium sp. J-067]
MAALSDLGATVDAYRARFSLRYRNNRAPSRYLIQRMLDGEVVCDFVVEVSPHCGTRMRIAQSV